MGSVTDDRTAAVRVVSTLTLDLAVEGRFTDLAVEGLVFCFVQAAKCFVFCCF